MLRINRETKTLAHLHRPSFSEADVTERYDLQEYICNSPNEFFSEVGEKLFVIGKEIVPSATVQDRIDVLALDPEGNAVIIELKRGNHKLQLLQSISYAGMISKWSVEEFHARLTDEQVEQLSEFLEVDNDAVNLQQRIILIAEAFDYAVLIAAEWLTEQFQAGISCCRVAIEKDEAASVEYLSCSSIFPNPELTQHAVRRGRRKKGSPSKWGSWEDALANVTNEAVINFFRKELAANRESYLRKKLIRFRINGKRRIWAAARHKLAYCWQQARFDGDVELWRKGLSQPTEVQEVKDGKCLRMFLVTEEDFAYFMKIVETEMPKVEWVQDLGDDGEELADGNADAMDDA